MYKQHQSMQMEGGVHKVDGVNVIQLLYELGEASATSSAVDLFALCLQVQRVIVPIQGVDLIPDDEAALLMAYRAADDNARSAMIGMMQSVATGSPRERPRLALVKEQHMEVCR